MHFRVVHRIHLGLAAALLSSVGWTASQPRDGVWSYDTNPKWPGAIYHFAGLPTVTLYGRCHETTVFSLSGGDYPPDASKFQVVVDGKSRTLPAYRGKHGRLLVVDDSATVHKLASAKRIGFRVGKWTRSLPGSPFIGRLIRECDALHR